MLRRSSMLAGFIFGIVLLAVPLRPLPPPVSVQKSDQARIDWLESNANSCCVEPKVDLSIAGRAFVQGEDLRESIDEACARCATGARETTPVIRMAAVVVRGLLPATAGAQSTAIVADSPARGTPVASAHSSHWLAITVALVVVVAAGAAWFISRRSFNSAEPNYQSPGDRGRGRPT